MRLKPGQAPFAERCRIDHERRTARKPSQLGVNDLLGVNGRQENSGLLLLPAATESLIELHDALVFVSSRLRQGKLGGVKRALAVNNFKICGGAPLVAQ